MPENPECHLMANYLHEECKDKMCHKIYIGEKSKYFKTPLKGFSKSDWVPQNGFIVIPINKVCVCVDAKGKKIGIFFEDICFIFSLGLEGSFRLTPGNNTGLAIEFENRMIYYDDSRRFGNFYLIHRNQLPEIMKDVGPDYLKGEVSLELFVNVIHNPKLALKQICWFLMEQKYLSGNGNYIKADALYLACISPYRLLSSLSDQDLINLYNAILKVTLESYHAKGKTIATYRNIDGSPGLYVNCCYGLSNDINGYPIVTCTLSDKRTTHWCPTLQH